MFVFGILGTNITEYCIHKRILRKITVRRIGGCMIAIGSLYLILLGYLPCQDVESFIVPLLILSSFRAGLWFSVGPSTIDISPTYQDTLVTANTVASFIPGMLVPLVIAQVGKDTREHWRKIFLVSVAVTNSSIGFYLLASTDRVLEFDEAAKRFPERTGEKKSKSEFASESKSISMDVFDQDGMTALTINRKWIDDGESTCKSIWDMDESTEVVQTVLDQVNEDIKSQRPPIEEAFEGDEKFLSETRKAASKNEKKDK